MAGVPMVRKGRWHAKRDLGKTEQGDCSGDSVDQHHHLRCLVCIRSAHGQVHHGATKGTPHAPCRAIIHTVNTHHSLSCRFGRGIAPDISPRTRELQHDGDAERDGRR